VKFDPGNAALLPQVVIAEADAVPASGHATAKRATEILLAHDARYHCPTRAERDALLVGFAMRRKTLYGAGYDMIRTDQHIDLADPAAIAAAIDAITVCEVKSTKQEKIRPDLKGYMFNITAAELLTAQSVGERYRFVFVHTVTGENQEMSLSEVLGRARGMYPAWHFTL
jgi:hypothetical protein